MKTKKEIKLEIATQHRDEIVQSIKCILSVNKSRMSLKKAMEVFLSVNVSNPENTTIFFSTGYQKVKKESNKFCKKMSSREYYCDRPEIFNQLPSSLR